MHCRLMLCVCNDKQLMLFDFLHFATQANSCHLFRGGKGLVRDFPQALYLRGRVNDKGTLRFRPGWVGRKLWSGGGKRRRKMWIPVGITVGGGRFSLSPNLCWSLGDGSRSHLNLLRSGRTQARALSSPGPARGAARPQGLADKRGAMKENTAPGSAGAVRVGDRGVPGSGGFCELNLAESERTLPGGPAWV